MRTLPPVGLLLDVDGPLASPETRTVPDGILRALVDLTDRGIPVVFNTGRSAQFVLHQLLAPLREAGLSPTARVHAVCEKGAVWFSAGHLPDGPLPEVTPAGPVPEWIRPDDGMRVPADLAERLAQQIRETHGESMFFDDTKLAMVSAEMTVGLALEDYRPAQAEFEEFAQAALAQAGLSAEFQVDSTIISSDIEHASSGKNLGAERAWELLAADGEMPVRWITCGDSRTDYAMAEWLHARGASVTHVDVRPGDGVPETAYPVLTPADLAAEGFGREDAIHEEAGQALLEQTLSRITGSMTRR